MSTWKTWNDGLRLLGLLPIVLIIGGYEYVHAFGGYIPIPFLAMFGAVVLAAVTGGRAFGISAAIFGSAEMFHCYLLGIGPSPLTGTLVNVLLGTALFCGTGYWLGLLRDQRDQTLEILADHRAGLEADLLIEIGEKERSLSDKAKHAARLRTAFRLARLGHFEFETATGNCVFCSPRHATHFGLTPDEFVEQTAGTAPALAFVHPDDRHIVLEAIGRIRSGQDYEFEYRTLHRNGDVHYIREIVEPEFDERGNVTREVGTSMDLTDLRLAEAKLRESQKLEAVGRLTAGVAHDFNNLLAVIMGNLELLGETGCDKDKAEMIEAALGATARGAALTSQLLSFGRKSILSPEPLDLCITIKELGALFQRTLPTSIEIDLPCIAGECMAFLDRAQFENAMLNLVVNASDAMPSGGKLRIDGEHRHFDDATIKRLGLDLEPGEYIGIQVTDTGTGMTENVRDRALEPFFTTKGVGKGTGLGLPMVLGFVKQSGGDVEITSQIGKGTAITVYFKAVHSPALPQVAKDPIPSTARGDGALILLVEDDANVRDVTARQIVSLGYRVLEAETAQSALDLLAKRLDVSLVLSDVVMPGELQGTDLVRRAKPLRPDLKFILMSGYHNIPSGTGIDAPLHVTRLTKPIRRDELALCLAEAVGG